MKSQNYLSVQLGLVRSVALTLALTLAACGTTQGPSPATPSGTAKPASPSTVPGGAAQKPLPAVNLAGYPLAFKEGFKDGCDSFRGAYRRDNVRFNADTDYAIGWQDGFSICRRQGK
jgi:hypothetical protein